MRAASMTLDVRIWIMLFTLFILLPIGSHSALTDKDIRAVLTTARLREWARRFSDIIYSTASEATQVNELIRRYQEAGATVSNLDPESVIDVMKDRLEKYLEKRKSLAKDLKDQLETSRATYQFLPHEEINEPSDEFNFYRYFDAKNGTNGVSVGERIGLRWVPETEKLNYQENPNFFGMPVDLEHVTIINEIKWSGILDKIFIDRRKRNFTSASWLFFCSRTGFMRYFPAAPWLYDRVQVEPPLDLYDCRNTEWFIDGATNSKNVVILLDISGSMLGQRFEIAKRTIDVILETLSENDFFNIIKFNDEPSYLYKCFENRLVQATIRNKHLIRKTLENFKEIKNIADYRSALPMAFQLLLQLNSSYWTPYIPLLFPSNRAFASSAFDNAHATIDPLLLEELARVIENGTKQLGCNSAIMLITDGADDYYEPIFSMYNPSKKIRFFSFLMGEDVTDFREVQWMACNNNGYFAHIANLADVQEKVQKYIDVMSRPLAQQNETRAIWTGSYFDRLGRRLVTTVAYPVIYNRTFLGVVGAAAPIAELQQRAPVYMLGANSYTFLVDNNGYMLFHPQLRPMVDNLPKPNYNSMDIMEVEVADEHDLDNETVVLKDKENGREREVIKMVLNPPLNYSHELRTRLVDAISSKDLFDRVRMTVLHAIDGRDGLKRVYRQRNVYYFRGINNTLLSLGLAVPEGAAYRVNPPYESQFPFNEVKEDWFEGNNWRLHPEWHYCRPNDSDTRAKELVFKDYVRMMKQTGSLPENCINVEFLINRLLFDAKVTCEMDMCWIRKSRLDNKNGIMLAFLVTQTGLTRYVDMNFADLNYDPSMAAGNDTLFTSRCEQKEQPYKHFIERSTRAVDEVFYKRAMQFQDGEFVFDVNVTNLVCLVSNNTRYVPPSRDRHSILITASRSVFLTGPAGAKAPVGVVGMEMLYTSFGDVLTEATDRFCRPDYHYTCFLLDEHAYVVYSSARSLSDVRTGVNVHVGKFFAKTGHVNNFLMSKLVDEKHGIFQKALYVDFQAMCPESITTVSASSRLLNPLFSVIRFLLWLFKKLSIFLAEYTSVWSVLNGILWPVEAFVPSAAVSQLREMSEGLVCDKASYYYLLNRSFHGAMSLYNKTPDGCGKNCRITAIAARVRNTNLILVVYTLGTTTCLDACFEKPKVVVDHEPKMVYNATDKVFDDDRCAVVRPRYRRAPSICYPMESANNLTDQPCSRSADALRFISSTHAAWQFAFSLFLASRTLYFI